MKYKMTHKFLLLAALLTCISLAGAEDKDDEMEMIDKLIMSDGVTFSEIEDSGQKRWEVRGSRAEAIDLDHIRIYDVNATFLTDDGRKVIMFSKYVDMNRLTREIKTDQYVTIMSEDNIMTGTGMRISTDDNQKMKKFTILNDVQILTLRKKEEMNIGNLKRTL